ncbi:hypothetical protein EsH8_VII_000003 [Colletotrichum jinshuiense]
MISDAFSNAFRSERLIYRAVENDEADRVFLHTQLANDPAIIALSEPMLLRPRSIKHSEWMAEQLAKSILAVMICLPHERSCGEGADKGEDEPPKPIGFMVLGWGGSSSNVAHHRSVDLGIALAAQYQGKGYGTETINWALDWTFRFGNYHRVTLCTVSYNKSAQHLYNKLGFVEEGRSRESHWFDRKWHDTISYGMLDREWEALRGLEKE